MISGTEGEAAAATALAKAGYRILERNLRTPIGEIDILALKSGFLCVVEVKARASDRFGSAAEAVTPAKQAKLRRLATCPRTMNCGQQWLRNGEPSNERGPAGRD